MVIKEKRFTHQFSSCHIHSQSDGPKKINYCCGNGGIDSSDSRYLVKRELRSIVTKSLKMR